MLLKQSLTPSLGRDFFPSVDAGQIRLHMRAPTGTRIEETAVRFTLKGQDVINVNSQPKSLVELTRSSSGKDGGGGGGQGAQGGQIDAATGQVIH